MPVNRLLAVWMALLLMAWPATGQQTTGETLRFSADRSTADLKQGLTRLEGSVVIHRGTTQVTADLALLYSADNRLQKVELHGKPARWQMHDADGQPMEAQAQTIVYHVPTDQIELKGQARISQGGNLARGEYFRIDRKSGHLLGGSLEGDLGRVELVLPMPEDEKTDAPR